jgi:prepilin-type N-terminal cleavage/methylation domain-containing protein/prepilin-type processing-associated H-X9-DG protein
VKSPSASDASHAFTLIELLVVIAIIGVLASMLLPALSSAKMRTTGVKCLSNNRQISLATRLYLEDNEGAFPPLHRDPVAGDPPTAQLIVPSASAVWWCDILSMSKSSALPDPKIFNCPALKVATTTVQSSTTPGASAYPLGIGFNYRGVDGVAITITGASTARAMEHEIANPSQTVILADSGTVTVPGQPDPDMWVEAPNSSAVYFRNSSDGSYTSLPVRVIGRHLGRTPAGFVDGHSEVVKPSALGFQYPARDPRALWDRY